MHKLLYSFLFCLKDAKIFLRALFFLQISVNERECMLIYSQNQCRSLKNFVFVSVWVRLSVAKHEFWPKMFKMFAAKEAKRNKLFNWIIYPLIIVYSNFSGIKSHSVKVENVLFHVSILNSKQTLQTRHKISFVYIFCW